MATLFNQTNLAPGKSFAGSNGGGGGGSNYPANALFSTIAVQTSASIPATSFTLNTTGSNVQMVPLNFTIRPDQATKGGQCYASFQFDAVDTGANYACVVGANNKFGFIGSVWPGFISMPFQVFGATVQIDSDNETFLFMDGKEGAQGTISTGVQFISNSNTLGYIQDPTKAYTADMTALLSTFKDLYPTCFV